MAPSATSDNHHNEISIKVTPVPDLGRGKDGAKELVMATMTEHISKIDLKTCKVGEADPFFVGDMGEVYRNQKQWKDNLPRVKPYYAVKCNPDPQVLRLLARMGTGFDCATYDEILAVLSLGVDPARIIYANPVKDAAYLRAANDFGVKQMTFDTECELELIKEFAPDAELVLRILVDDSSSACRLGQKFGASLDICSGLLSLAKELDLDIVGVSFHCGSGVSDPSTFACAVKDARKVFDQALAVGFEPRILDVGGGFSSHLFEPIAQSLNQALDKYFPSPSVAIIAEPGRYYVEKAFTLGTLIINHGKKTDLATGDVLHKIFMNDGVYGNFAGKMYDHQHFHPQILRKRDPSDYAAEYILFGPTCDGIDHVNDGLDAIEKRLLLPGNLKRNDWLYFENMGAYSMCCTTTFNGFPKYHKRIYVSSELGATALLGLDNTFEGS